MGVHTFTGLTGESFFHIPSIYAMYSIYCTYLRKAPLAHPQPYCTLPSVHSRCESCTAGRALNCFHIEEGEHRGSGWHTVGGGVEKRHAESAGDAARVEVEGAESPSGWCMGEHEGVAARVEEKPAQVEGTKG